MNKKALIFFLLMTAFVVILLFVVDNNEGKPSDNLEGDIGNCGVSDIDCHKNHTDSSVSIYTTPDGDDTHIFAAPIEKDSEKLGSSDYKVQAKAVARGGKEPYIDWLDDTNNEGQLDLNKADPEAENNETFWIGFGYRDENDHIHVYVDNEGYKYRKQNKVPVPKAEMSIDSDFPEDDEQTIRVEENDDYKTLTATLPKDGTLTVYFSGSKSTDEDGDDLEYYWDIDGDGRYETGDSGDNLDERGETYEFEYSETGTYELKFRVADGMSQSDSIFFTLEIKETEKKPELYVDEITVELEDGSDASDADIIKGDLLTIAVFVRNHDDSGYGDDTPNNVLVNIYYALDSEDFDTWYLIDDDQMPINLYRIQKEGQKQASYEWDTSDFYPDEYKLMARVDEDDDNEEWNEDNNEEEYDTILEIQEYEPPMAPELVLEDLDLTPSTIYANDDVEIDVTIKNTGEGDAENVFMKLYIENKYKKASAYFTVPADGSVKLSDTGKGAFTWSPSQKGSYDIKLEITYYYESEEYKVTLEEDGIEVFEESLNPNGTGDPGTEELGEEDGWFLDFPPSGLMAVVLVASSVLYARKRR